MSDERRAAHHRMNRVAAICVIVITACWTATTAVAAPTCSRDELARLRAGHESAQAHWQGSRNTADHEAFAASRAALVSYATSCADALGDSTTKLLSGAVVIPTVQTPPLRAPGDTVDLFITHVPTSISGPAGATLTYALLIANQGAPATTPCMADIVFASESPAPAISVTGFEDPNWGADSCAGAGLPGSVGGFYCCLGENLGSTYPYTYWTLRAQVTASDAVTMSSEANTAAVEFETNNGNNTTTATLRVTASSGVSVTANGPANVTAGTSLTYSVAVSNAGPSTAEAVILKDFVPNEVDITFISTSGGSCSNTPGSQTVTCNLGNLGSGASRNITISGIVKPNIPDGTVIFNDAQVSSSTADPDNADNVDTVGTTVDGATSGLALVQSGPASATAGNDVTYTSTITNVGTTPAANAVFRAVPPTELDLVSFSASAGDCNANGQTGASCNLGTIVPAGSRTVSVTYKVRTNTPGGTTLFHTGQVSSDAFESSNSDNLDTDATTITGATSGLTVAISGPATVVAGTPIAYDVTLDNVGVDQATNVQLKDVVPADIDVTGFTISQGNCGATGGGLTGTTVTCTVGTLPAGGQVTATVNGVVKASVADGTIELNTVSATGTVFESDTGDNTATASTTVDAQADLAIDTVDSTDPVNIDTPFRWVNTITNAGPSDATGVVVIDTIPHLVEELKVRVLPSGCDRFEETIKCSLGTIKAGQTVTMNVELEAMVNAGPSISHTVEVASLADDPNLADNTDTETTTLQAPDMVGSFTTLSSACDATLAVCQIKGKFKVTNAGNAKSVQSALRFVYSANTTLGSGDPQLKKFTVNQLKPGESQEFKYNLVFPINQYVIAQVDSANQIAETNEANNLSLKGPFPKP